MFLSRDSTPVGNYGSCKFSANHTSLNTIISASVRISVPHQNLLSFTGMICFTVKSIFLYVYGIFNGNTFLQIPRKFTFQNIANSSLMLEFCSAITMAACCILSVWLLNGTTVRAMVFRCMYLLIMINTLTLYVRGPS